MTEAEVICTFMEPKPRFVEVPDLSVGRWWLFTVTGKVPIRLTLDRLNEVEARLTEKQRGEYVRFMMGICPDLFGSTVWGLIHATAEQKIKALAAVLQESEMANERDPRVDPKVGDRLYGLNGGRMERRTVTSVNKSFVMYTRSSRIDAYMGKGTESCRCLRSWQSWAKNAEVIHAAE